MGRTPGADEYSLDRCQQYPARGVPLVRRHRRRRTEVAALGSDHPVVGLDYREGPGRGDPLNGPKLIEPLEHLELDLDILIGGDDFLERSPKLSVLTLRSLHG